MVQPGIDLNLKYEAWQGHLATIGADLAQHQDENESAVCPSNHGRLAPRCKTCMRRGPLQIDGTVTLGPARPAAPQIRGVATCPVASRCPPGGSSYGPSSCCRRGCTPPAPGEASLHAAADRSRAAAAPLRP